MIGLSITMPRLYSNTISKAVTTALVLASVSVIAADRDDAVLEEEAYRTEIEEVVVTGQAPEWRQEQQEQQWRQEKFKLAEPGDLPGPRMEWFPEYDRDERDDYDGVRDRMDEKPLIKIFEWKF
jgi:hypothetical protein